MGKKTFDYELKVGEEMETTEELVRNILEKDIRCRNSDKRLVWEVLNTIAKRNGHKIFIPFDLFEKFPAYETISRVRRKIQNNEGNFIPTDPQVIEKRGIKQDIFRKKMKY